jgi:hypothetical protein
MSKTVISISDIELQPLTFVTVTVYDPEYDGLITTFDVVFPKFQINEFPPRAVILAELPLQIRPSFNIPEFSFKLIEADGNRLTVTILENDLVQPLELVATTVYVVVASGDKLNKAFVLPLFHKYDTPPLAIKLTDAPSQMTPSFEDTPDSSIAEKATFGN